MRAVCAAAKWGSEATSGLSRRVLHPLLLALGRSQPAPGWLPDSGEPGGGGSSPNELQPQLEAVSEVMGAGGEVATAKVLRRSQRWGFRGAGLGMGRLGYVLGRMQATEWF